MSVRRRLRVLMFTATLGYGGSESAFVRLGHYLSRTMDVTITLMARDYGSHDYSNAQSEAQLPVVLLDTDPSTNRGPIRKAARWFRMFWKLRALKHQHDVTISFLSGPNLLNALAAGGAGTIVSERGSKRHHVGIPVLRKWLWLRLLDPITYRSAGWIVPASTGYAQEVASIAGPGLVHKIVPIEGGVDAATLIRKSEAPVDADIARFCQGPTAVYSGRLDIGKGIDLIIPAFAGAARRAPETRLLIIGDGPLKSQIADLCRSERLSVTEEGDPEAKVFIAGYREDPIRNFRLCDLFLFPSLHEALGNSLIEGIASGIPVLAADCPWGPRSILSGSDDPDALLVSALPLRLANGTLMPLPDTPEGVACWEDAIVTELSHGSRRRSPDERRAAIARFDLEVTGKEWEALIERAVASDSHGDTPVSAK